MRGDIARKVEEIFRGIAQAYESEIETTAVVEGHVYISLSAPPKYAPGDIVGILKTRSAKAVFKEFSRIRKEFWGGEFWSDGYFVKALGGEVTAQVISRYIEYHNSRQLVFDF